MGQRLTVVVDGLRHEWALARAAQRRTALVASEFIPFGELLRWCALPPGQGLGIASSVVVESLFLRLAPLLGRSVFGPASEQWAFCVGLRRLIDGLEAQAVRPSQLRAAAVDSPAGRAVAEVWLHLHEELGLRGLQTAGQALTEDTNRLAKQLPVQFRPYDEVVLDGLWNTRPSQLKFLQALAAALEAAGKRLVWPMPTTGVDTADVSISALLRQVERDWQQVGADVRPESTQHGCVSVLGSLVAGVTLEREAPVDVVLAPRLDIEEREVARRIAVLIGEGVAPEDIAVCRPEMPLAAARWAEALGQHGIAARGVRETPLHQTPVGRFALETAWLAERAFASESLAPLLASRYAMACGAIDVWRFFSEAGVVDAVRGADQHASGVVNRLRELQQRLRHERDRSALEHLVARCELFRAHFSLPDRAELEVFASQWWAGLQAVGLFEAVERGRGDDVELLAHERLAFATLREVIFEAREAARQASTVATVVSRRLFLDWLETAFQRPVRQPGPRAGAVWLLEPAQVAGGRLQHLFWVGAEEERWPPRPRASGVLAEAEQAALNRVAGRQLFRLAVTEGELVVPAHEADARLVCGLALASTQAVTFSFSRVGPDEREQHPSSWVSQLLRDPSCVRSYPSAQSVPQIDACTTIELLRRRVALESLAPAAGRMGQRNQAIAAAASLFEGEQWLSTARQVAAMELERATYWADEATSAGPFSGAVGATRAQRLAAFDSHRPASAKVLQDFAACRFRGFATHWLRLLTPESSAEDVSRREVGTLWHGVLQRAVPEMVAAGLWQRPQLSDAQVRPLVAQAVASTSHEVASKRPTGHPLVWQLQIHRSIDAVTSFLLRTEAGLPHLTPREMESSFGGRVAPLVLPAAFEGEVAVSLQGHIDRIDGGPNGEAVAVDYKRGRAGTPPERAAALLTTEFQLSLYAFALAQRSPPPVSVDAAWLGVRKKDQLLLSSVLQVLGSSVPELLDVSALGRQDAAARQQPNLANAVHGLVQQVRQGDVGPRPRDCSFCDFAALCRIGSRRLGA